MPNILAIDTTSALCQVGLQSDNSVSHSVCDEKRAHAQRLLPMIDELLSAQQLKLSELDLISVCTGPGSFTGIRIGVGVAQGLAMALHKPVLGISSLEALAYSGTKRIGDAGEQLLLSAIVARTEEVYFAIYRSQDGKMSLCGKEAVSAVHSLDGLPQSELAAFAIGNGWKYEDSLRRCLDGNIRLEEVLDSQIEVAPIGDTLKLVLSKLSQIDLAGESEQSVVPNYLKEHLVYSS